MKKFFAWLARYLNDCGQPITPLGVAEEFRVAFDRVKPALVERGWPVPVTDEGKSVCLDLMFNPFTRW